MEGWNERMLAALASNTRASSGLTALATTTDAPVEALAPSATGIYHHVEIINEGAVGGFYSLDGGITWDRLSAGSVASRNFVTIENKAIQIKRAAGGADLADVYVTAW